MVRFLAFPGVRVLDVPDEGTTSFQHFYVWPDWKVFRGLWDKYQLCFLATKTDILSPTTCLLTQRRDNSEAEEERRSLTSLCLGLPTFILAVEFPPHMKHRGGEAESLPHRDGRSCCRNDVLRGVWIVSASSGLQSGCRREAEAPVGPRSKPAAAGRSGSEEVRPSCVSRDKPAANGPFPPQHALRNRTCVPPGEPPPPSQLES